MDRVANHKTSSVTDVYDRHGYADEDKRIMAAVARHVLSLVEGSVDRQRGQLALTDDVPGGSLEAKHRRPRLRRGGARKGPHERRSPLLSHPKNSRRSRAPRIGSNEPGAAARTHARETKPPANSISPQATSPAVQVSRIRCNRIGST